MKNMFRSCGYLLLAGGLAIALSSPVAAQPSPAASEDNWNKYSVGVFGGGQFWHLFQDNSTGSNGHLEKGVAVGVRGDLDMSPHLGLEVQWIFWARNNLRLETQQPYPITSVGLGAHNGQVYAGPLFYLNGPSSTARVFVTVGPTFQYFTPSFDATREVHDNPAFNTLTLQTKNSAAGSFGGGVKWAVGEHWNLRFDVRGTYAGNPHWDLSPVPTGPGSLYLPSKGRQLGVLASIGLDRAWGKHAGPPPIVMKDCHGRQIPETEPCPNIKITVTEAADQTEVCAGTAVHVTATTDAPATATYKWTVNGEAAGQDKTFTFDTSNRAAGNYTVALTVSAPGGYDDGTGSVSVTVKAYVAPTGTATANPAEIWLGEKSSLSASGANQCDGAVRVTGYSASEGTVTDATYDSTGVQFDSANHGEQRKPVTITANLKDDRGEGTATTTVVVKKKAEPRHPSQLSDVIFARNSARVNNCGKRVLLEELKTYRDADPSGKVLLIGHTDKGENKKMHLDENRALNAAAVLTAATGICSNFSASQVLVKADGTEQSAEYKAHFCEASVRERASGRISANDKRAQFRRVEVWWIPSDAEMPAAASGAKDAASMGVEKRGCPK